MSGENAYGTKFVCEVLRREKGFNSLQLCYYFLYQCLVPNPSKAFSILLKHYSDAKHYEKYIMFEKECRFCNQGIFNFLLLMLRRDRDILKFWSVIKSMVNQPELKKAVEKMQRGISIMPKWSVRFPVNHDDVISTNSVNKASTLDTSDCCVGCAAPGVNARKCARPPRLSVLKQPSNAIKLAKDDEAEIFPQMHSHKLSPNGIAVLKKHYRNLLSSLPWDYKATLNKLCQAIPVGPETFDQIISCSTSLDANKKILRFLVFKTKNDLDLLDFCSSLEKILPNVPTVLKALRNDCLKIVEASGNVITSPSTTPAVIASDQSLATSVVPVPTASSSGQEILIRHYDALWKSFPKDYGMSLSLILDKLLLSDENTDYIISQSNFMAANKALLDVLLLHRGPDKALMEFCDLVQAIIKDKQKVEQVVEPLRIECIQLMFENSTSSTKAHRYSPPTSSQVATTPSSHTTSLVTSMLPSTEGTDPQNNVHLARPSLGELQNIITPNYAAHWKIIGTQLGIHSGTLDGIQYSFPADAFRCCDDMLEKWLETDINATWSKIFEVLESPRIKTNIGCPENKVLELQSPPPLPANYIPRWEFITEICCALLKCDETAIISIKATVTIRGVGGFGKSTLAKAVCQHPLIKNHFTDGFLWIPPFRNPEVVLKDVYSVLTNKSATCNFSILKDTIRTIVSTKYCKLLVILDNVVDIEDAEAYVDVFSSCKIVVTTRKNDTELKIPCRKSLNVGSMKPDEAVPLLTYEIAQFNTLTAADTNKLQKLANDLHYWPLLLKLVHGQLYLQCTALKESPTDAILSVQQRLRHTGLTAFDDPKNVSQDRAVKACIDASLELLSHSEKRILFITVSSMGIGSYVYKEHVFKLSKICSQQFQKLTLNLWSHGLISFENVKIFSVTDAVTCIEVHDVIAQYITEEIPDGYYPVLQKMVNTVFNFVSELISVDQTTETDSDYFVSLVDELTIPFTIRLFSIVARAQRIEFQKFVQQSIESNEMFLETSAMDKFFDTELSISNTYGAIKHDCKVIQSILADNRHDEAEKWLIKYMENHPLKEYSEILMTFFIELNDECIHDLTFVDALEKAYKDNWTLCNNSMLSIIRMRQLLIETKDVSVLEEFVSFVSTAMSTYIDSIK